MITRQKANSPSYVTISPPPFCKGEKELSPLCISKGQPPTVLDSALAKVYHIRHASTSVVAIVLHKKPCLIRKGRAKGLTLLAKACIIKIKKAPSIDGCPRIVEK